MEGTEHGEESRSSARGEGRRFLARLVGGRGEKRGRGEARVLLRGGETAGTGVEESHVRWVQEFVWLSKYRKRGVFFNIRGTRSLERVILSFLSFY